ncbi:uncharacterized protein LOC107616198 [Arachis ipaensis]|uniref:uncharacterized protein LOC107616198 n=1 Tax=Arachis ipaensis TaxID=130454 RepID=UPI0007AEF702|nr:uncharacterized protein LOC107616198 [Arachis ipaensis]
MDHDKETPIVANSSFSASDLQNLARVLAQISNLQSQIPRSPVSSITDPSSPYFVHPEENPGISIINVVLTTRNYDSWSRAMTIALKCKNKFCFVDGSLPKPQESDPNFMAWEKCNALVVSWFISSISEEILRSVIWNDNAADIWRDLKHRYYEGDVFRVADLEEQMFSIKQGELSITSYFARLKAIWQELDSLRPIPDCNCGESCSCGLGIVRNYRKDSYLVRLLRGLNDQYSVTRSQIMLMEPLPTLNDAFALLTQQEQQFGTLDILEANAVSAAQTTVNATIGSQSFTVRGRGSRGRGGRTGRPPTRMCSFCHKSGHLVDTCYRKHGLPPHLK